MSNKDNNSVDVENDLQDEQILEAKPDKEEDILEGEIVSETKNPYEKHDINDKSDKIKELLKNSVVDTSDKTPRLIGFAVIIFVFGFLFVWSYTARLDSAAYAPGKVTVEGSTKTIQHLEGGIVKEIYVKDGQLVKEGDLLLLLDDTQLKAQLDIIEAQYIAILGLSARLQAEQKNSDKINFSHYLLEHSNNSDVAEVMQLQREIFNSRKIARGGQVNVLKQRIDQLKEQIKGLQAQRISSTKQIKLYNEEINEFKDLLKSGFTDKTRMRDMQRKVAELGGLVGRYKSDIEAAKVRIGETKLQIIQIENEHQQEVAEQLSDTLVKTSDLEEKLLATRDKVNHTRIVAQNSGVVLSMSIHTIGGVVTPGKPILEIVPQGGNLIIEAHVSTSDIDKVHTGLVSEVRFSSFKNSTTPIVMGTVLTVSADSLIDETTRMPYFLARIRVTPESYKKLGNLKLMPGMPADTLIKTGERTVFEYLIPAAGNALARSFIED